MERPLLFSVGHGTRPIEAFIALLRRAGVRRLVDVRTAPGSRRNPQFGKDALAEALEAAGIEYVWRGAELGGFRTPRPDSRHTALRHDGFRGYADHMDTPAFVAGLEWLLASGAETPTAFLCAESDWHRCHRRMISDAVLARGGRVVHLLDRGDEEHVLHPVARIEDGRPVYDGGAPATLVEPTEGDASQHGTAGSFRILRGSSTMRRKEPHTEGSRPCPVSRVEG